MANLIPQAAKKDIKTEYWIRVVSVWLFLLGIAALTLTVLNAPVYLLVQNQLHSYGSLFDDASAQSNSYEKVEAEIIAANENSTLLIGMNNIKPMVPLITEIESLVSREIEISRFIVKRAGIGIQEVSVSGEAANRTALVNFSDRIESTDTFSQAEIPLSNLAKDRDIPFTINVVVATE